MATSCTMVVCTVSDPPWFIVVGLLLLGILSAILNEMSMRSKDEMRSWFAASMDSFRRYLAKVPNLQSRREHKAFALGLIATAVFALGPLGYAVMEAHPCAAWGWWAAALLCAACSFWSIVRLSRLVRLIILFMVVIGFALFARWLLYSETELNFFFVNPGVFLVRGTGDWLLGVTGQNTHKSLFNVQMVLQDMVAARAIPNEPDLARRTAMIEGETLWKTYPEIGPTFLGDNIQWHPTDVNNQDYSIQARYRIGDKAFVSTEEIRIVNVGTRFVSPGPNFVVPTWVEAVTVRNQSGEILMHCVDSQFPHDDRWIPGPACFPGANFGPLPRSLCARCFGRGFEYIEAVK